MKANKIKKVYISPYLFVHRIDLEENLMSSTTFVGGAGEAEDGGTINLAPPHTFDDWNTEDLENEN